MKPNESKGYQNCWTGRALQSHLHPQHAVQAVPLHSLLAAPHPTRGTGTLKESILWGLGFFWGEGEGMEKKE